MLISSVINALREIVEAATRGLLEVPWASYLSIISIRALYRSSLDNPELLAFGVSLVLAVLVVAIWAWPRRNRT